MTGRSASAATALVSAAGIATVLFATRWGIGTSVDSVAYIQDARALASGSREVSLVQHAPLYPLLLAAGAAAGVDPMNGARWLNALTFGVNIALVGLLIRSCTSHLRALGVVGATLMLVLEPMVKAHVTALSEPVFLTCTLAGFWCLAGYLERSTSTRLVAAAALMGLAVLARYAGAAGVLCGAAAIALMGTATWPRRLRDVALFSAIALLPMTIWVARNLVVAKTATGRELAFHPVGLAHAWQALYTASGWLLIPPSAPNALRFGIWLGLGTIAATVMARTVSTGTTPIPPVVRLLTLFVLTYGAFLTASITFLDANTPLDDRILLPVLAVAIVLSMYVVDTLWPLARRRPALIGASVAVIVLLTAGHGLRAAELAAASHEKGWGFTAAAWRESPTLARVATLDPAVPVFSNAPEIVYLHTGRAARGVPRTKFLMSQRRNPEFETEMAAIHDEVRGACGVVVYLRNLAQQSMPTEAEAADRLSLNVLADQEDGVIWGVSGCRR
jgi:hypothetical protein